jgi:hypothetical protein
MAALTSGIGYKPRGLAKTMMVVALGLVSLMAVAASAQAVTNTQMGGSPGTASVGAMAARGTGWGSNGSVFDTDGVLASGAATVYRAPAAGAQYVSVETRFFKGAIVCGSRPPCWTQWTQLSDKTLYSGWGYAGQYWPMNGQTISVNANGDFFTSDVTIRWFNSSRQLLGSRLYKFSAPGDYTCMNENCTVMNQPDYGSVVKLV